MRGLCQPAMLMDYIENFILFDQRKGGVINSKIIAKNHQFLGVNNAFHAFENRAELKGKLGVFWHTQGSGKSYSMTMLARKIKHKCIGNFTFLIVTDRDDLDGQIYKTFLRSGFMSAEEKVQPATAAKLREELDTNKSIIFTLIHKFRPPKKGQKYPVINKRDDIIVFVDEAHRTQYKDLAENMRTGLPNAQFFAFTGTPLLGNKRLTNSWFGDYVSEYNFAESIKDNATVPLYYVKRVPEVELQNDFLESDFSEILEDENLTEAEQKRLENYYSQELEVIKRDDRLDAVAQHIVQHFPHRGFKGKGMVIAVDKFTAVKLYDKVAEDAKTYTINESGKEIDISKMDVDELREMFKKVRNKNLEIANLREHIEKKLAQMLRKNTTRSDFAERFRGIIDEYNAGGSRNDNFYEKILKFMEDLRAEEERHVKEDLTEEELEIFDLLRKDKLTQDEEKRVKLAAKELYATLVARKKELFVVGWQNDPQPKEKVRSAIVDILNSILPDCYDREIFTDKSNRVYQHIIDQAIMGYAWAA